MILKLSLLLYKGMKADREGCRRKALQDDNRMQVQVQRQGTTTFESLERALAEILLHDSIRKLSLRVVEFGAFLSVGFRRRLGGDEAKQSEALTENPPQLEILRELELIFFKNEVIASSFCIV